MEFNTTKDIENPLFKRREIEGIIKAEIVPSRKDVKKILSEKFSFQPECIKIKNIKGKFGRKDFSVIANLYSSKEEKDKVEYKKKKEIEEEKRILEEEKKVLEEEKAQESPQKEQEEKSEEAQPEIKNEEKEPTKEENK